MMHGAALGKHCRRCSPSSSSALRSIGRTKPHEVACQGQDLLVVVVDDALLRRLHAWFFSTNGLCCCHPRQARRAQDPRKKADTGEAGRPVGGLPTAARHMKSCWPRPRACVPAGGGALEPLPCHSMAWRGQIRRGGTVGFVQDSALSGQISAWGRK